MSANALLSFSLWNYSTISLARFKKRTKQTPYDWTLGNQIPQKMVITDVKNKIW